MSNKRRMRRVRRQQRAALRFGVNAKPKHKLKTGRTGGVQAKKLKSRRPKE